MIKNNKTFYLGLFIFLIPFFGLPTSGRTFLVTISGLLLILFSVKFSLPGRNVPRRLRRKEKVTPVWSESMPTIKSEASADLPKLPDVENSADVANGQQ